MKLTSAEMLRGWVVFSCPVDGDLVATTPFAQVLCACGRRAHPTRDGQRMPRTTLGRIKASAKSLQIEGSEIVKSPLSEKSTKDGETPARVPERSV